MKIRMLETRRGSEDGHTVRRYEADKQYDVADSLAMTFLRNGWAERAEPLTQMQVMSEVFDSIFSAFGHQPLSATSVTVPVPNPSADGPRVATLMRDETL